MPKFKVYVDERIHTWRRNIYEIEADNLEQCIDKAKVIDPDDDGFIDSHFLLEEEVLQTDDKGKPIKEIHINDNRVI